MLPLPDPPLPVSCTPVPHLINIFTCLFSSLPLTARTIGHRALFRNGIQLTQRYTTRNSVLLAAEASLVVIQHWAITATVLHITVIDVSCTIVVVIRVFLDFLVPVVRRFRRWTIWITTQTRDIKTGRARVRP